MSVQAHERITIPSLDCPAPEGLNPLVQDAERYAIEWARDHGLAGDGDEYGIGRAHIGYLASYAHPKASWAGLRIAVEWLDWLMVYDDAMLDKLINVKKLDYSRLTAFHADILAIMRGERVDDAGQPLYRAMRSLMDSIHRLRPDWDTAPFIHGFHQYLQSNLWEATNMWRGRTPRLSTYTAMRRHTGCLFPTYRLSAALNGIELDPAIQDHVAINQLEIMANNYTCWINDIFSFERELVDGHVNQLVMVLQGEHGCGYQEAANMAAEMCRIEAESYVDLKECLPGLGLGNETQEQVREYTAVLEAWMRALYDWHHMTGRYQVVDLHAATDPTPATS